MTTVQLGAEPNRIAVYLNRDGDFSCVLHSASIDWPASSVITLTFGDATWTATKTGPDATFTADFADVNAVLTQAPCTARLWYTDGTVRLLWGLGPVITHG